MRQSEYYKDILTYIETRIGLLTALKNAVATKDHNRKQLYLHIAEQRQKEIDEWLNKEVENIEC